MKRRFKVLTIPQEYDLSIQAWIVSALAVVHNFMKIQDPNDLLFKDRTLGSESDTDESMTAQGEVDWDSVSARRDKIAQDMWKDYQSNRKRT